MIAAATANLRIISEVKSSSLRDGLYKAGISGKEKLSTMSRTLATAMDKLQFTKIRESSRYGFGEG
jgi:hypothetical protein